MTLQLHYDERIIGLLDPEQRENLPQATPILMRFDVGTTFDGDTAGNRGF